MSDNGKHSGFGSSQKGPCIDRQSLERLADLLGIGLFKINLKTGDINLNLNTTKLTGHDIDDLPTTEHTRDYLLVPEDRDLVNGAINSVIGGQSDHYRIEYRMRRRDSSIASFEEAGIVSERTEDGGPLCLAGMALDLSRLKWAEEKSRNIEMELKRLALGRDDKYLIEENRLLRATIDSAAMVIGGFHQSYETVLIQAIQMLGESVQADFVGFWRNVEREGSMYCYLKFHWTTRAHIIGADKGNTQFNYDGLFPGWKEKLAENKYVICDGCDVSGEFLDFFNIGGAQSILLIPYYLHGGFWGMMVIVRNEKNPFTEPEADAFMAGTKMIAFSISRNERLGKITMDREKAMANTMAKGEFLSRMSHEMRTPLNAIIGMTNFALKEKDPQKIMDYLKKVEVSSHLMLNIINDVLDMSKIEAGKLEIVKEPFDFAAMLKNAETIVKVKMEEKQQRFTVCCDNSITNMIISDEHRLLQVIVNLLNNAMKFTPNEGDISLSAAQRKIGGDKVRINVEVIDSGIGLTLEQQKKVFNAFEQADGSITRKYGGTGLGLVICKKILNALGGDIWVTSSPNQGARFFFELEASLGDTLNESDAAKTAPFAANEEPVVNDWGKYTILLADDVEINREIIEISLSTTGAKIVSAVDGEEAVKKFSAKPELFDLILMDVQMPVMDGLTATRHIRAMDDQRAKEIPIIAMTANAFKEDIDICLDAGMTAHVAKPIDMELFFKVLHKHLK